MPNGAVTGPAGQQSCADVFQMCLRLMSVVCRGGPPAACFRPRIPAPAKRANSLKTDLSRRVSREHLKAPRDKAPSSFAPSCLHC